MSGKQALLALQPEEPDNPTSPLTKHLVEVEDPFSHNSSTDRPESSASKRNVTWRMHSIQEPVLENIPEDASRRGVGSMDTLPTMPSTELATEPSLELSRELLPPPETTLPHMEESSRGGSLAPSRMESRRSSKVSVVSYDSEGNPKEKAGPEDVSQETLAYYFEALEAADDPDDAAFTMLWFFDADVLDTAILQCICNNHKIRKQNERARCKLYLMLVQHGASTRATAPLPDAERGLLPEGWVQVTRTAWATRQFPEWWPGMVLTSSVRCCMDTAERFKLIADEADVQDTLQEERDSAVRAQGAAFMMGSTRSSGSKTSVMTGKASWRRASNMSKMMGSLSGRKMSNTSSSKLGDDGGPKEHPEAIVCEMLDGHHPIHHVAESLRDEFDLMDWPPKGDAPVPATMLVGGGAAMENILACITVGTERGESCQQRLGGGDALLLQSPTMLRIVTRDKQEIVRPTGELWNLALQRGGWKLIHHFHGDGSVDSGSAGKRVALGDIATAALKEHADALGEIQWAEQLGRPPPEPKKRRPSMRKLSRPEEAEERSGTKDSNDSQEGEEPKPGVEARRGSRGPDQGEDEFDLDGGEGEGEDRTEQWIDPLSIPSATRASWRKFAGEPLILSQFEFNAMCERAGNKYRGPAEHLTMPVRPLVWDFDIDEVEF